MKSQAERLSEALAASHVSRRDLAVALIGEGATKEQITSKKSQIVKWLKGDGISDENARRLAQAFTSLGHPCTERAFFKDPAAPRSWHEAMAALSAKQDALQAGQDEILERLRKLG